MPYLLTILTLFFSLSLFSQEQTVEDDFEGTDTYPQSMLVDYVRVYKNSNN